MDKDQQIEKIVAELMDRLGVSAVIQVDTQEEEEKPYFNIDITLDENGSHLIGYRGNTLESITTLLKLMLPAELQEYGVVVDVNGYRRARIEYLKDLTHKAVAEVNTTNQSIVLLPMKPWERRVVHMTISDDYGLATESMGEEPNRSVVIKPKSE